MGNRITFVKERLEIVANTDGDDDSQYTPDEVWSIPVGVVGLKSYLSLTLEAVEQSSRKALRVMTTGQLPGSLATVAWVLRYRAFQDGATPGGWVEMALTAGALNAVVVEYPIPNATYQFQLVPMENGTLGDGLAVASIETPVDTTLDALATAKARLDAIKADGIVSDEERPDLRVLRASLSAQVVAAKAKADAMVPAMAYAALTAAWNAFVANATPVIDGSGNTVIDSAAWDGWWSAVAAELQSLAGAMANKAQATGTSAKAVADAAALVLTNIADDGQLTDQERPGGVASLSALKGQWQAAWTQAVTRGVSAAVLTDMRDTVWKPSYSTIAATLYAIPSATNYDSYGSVVIGARLTGTAALPAGYLTYLNGLHNVIIDLLNKTAAVPASAANPGVVKVGAGLSVDGSGVLSATATALPIASTTVLGGIKGSASISIDPVTGVATANVGSGGGWTPGTALSATTGTFSGDITAVKDITATKVVASANFLSSTTGVANFRGNWPGTANWGLGSTTAHNLRLGMTDGTGAFLAAPGDLTFQIDGILTAASAQFSGSVNVIAANACVVVKGGGAANGFQIQSDSGKNAYIWNYENTSMFFGSNNATGMVLSPSGGLSVTAGISATTCSLSSNLTISNGASLFLNSGGTQARLYGDASGNLLLNYNMGSSSGLYFYGGGTSSVFTVSGSGVGTFVAGAVLGGTNATNQLTLMGSSGGSSSQSATLRFTDAGQNQLTIATNYASTTNLINLAPGGSIMLALCQSSATFNTTIYGGMACFSGYVTSNGLTAANNPDGLHGGLWLYGTVDSGTPAYGLAFRTIAQGGSHGDVSADWATYNYMGGSLNRGWIWQAAGTNVASISGTGNQTLNGYLKLPNASVIGGSNTTFISMTGSGVRKASIVGNWGGAGYWGLVGEVGLQTVKLTQFDAAGNTIVESPASGSINLKLGQDTVYHTGNIDTSLAATQAVKALAGAPVAYENLSDRPAASSVPKNSYVYIIKDTSFDGQPGTMYRSDGANWSGPMQAIYVGGRASFSSVGATALASEIAMTTVLRSTVMTHGYAGGQPVGFCLYGNLTNSVFYDGSSALVNMELGDGINFGGYNMSTLAIGKLVNGGTLEATSTVVWKCPRAITKLIVTLVGGGGGGGAALNTAASSGGGGGGGTVQAILNVVPGRSYEIGIGAGGAGAPYVFGQDNYGNIGGDSYVWSSADGYLLRAVGGGGGVGGGVVGHNATGGNGGQSCTYVSDATAGATPTTPSGNGLTRSTFNRPTTGVRLVSLCPGGGGGSSSGAGSSDSGLSPGGGAYGGGASAMGAGAAINANAASTAYGAGGGGGTAGGPGRNGCAGYALLQW